MKSFFSIILIVLPISSAVPQTGESKPNLTINNLYNGLKESVEWYDIPVGAAYLSAQYSPIILNRRLNIQQLSIDDQIQSEFSGIKKKSFGSADPQKIVAAIFGARMVFNIASGLTSDENTGHENFKHAFLFYKAFVYSRTLTEFVKNFTNRRRPNGEDNRSFFSGHASMTFTASAFLYREIADYLNGLPLAYKDPFLCTTLKTAAFTGLYGWAAYVGYSRIYDNKHYFSDVLVGAAVGTLVGNWIYSSYLDHEAGLLNNVSLGMINNQPSINFLYLF
jgi:hypothetical protein